MNLSLFSESSFSDDLLGIGPVVSYYFNTPNGKVYPFVSGNYLLTTELQDSPFNIHSFQLSGGAALMVARNVALSGEAFYQQTLFAREGSSNESGNTLGLLFGVAVFVFGGVN